MVVNTAAGKRYGQNDYVSYGCGMGHDATMYLLERGAESLELMAELGRPLSIRESAMKKPVMPASSGKGTKPVERLAIATLKKCITLKFCPLMAL